MKTRLLVTIAVAFLLFFLNSPVCFSQDNINREAKPGAAGNLDLVLTVDNPSGHAFAGEPVTSGVPAPAVLNLKNLNQLRLLDEEGKPVPAQFTPTARWGGAPDDQGKPIRWLLIDFQADLPANGKATYRLVNSGGKKPKFPKLRIRNKSAVVKVITGSGKFKISKKNGKLTYRKPRATLTGRAMDKDGKVYSTIGQVEVTVALQGRMRASIVVKGKYLAKNSVLLDYTTRYWFYAGKSRVLVFHTVENNKPGRLAEYEQITCHDIGSGNSVDVRDVSMVLDAKLGGNLKYAVPTAIGPIQGSLTNNLTHYQDSSGTKNWNRYPTFKDWNGKALDTRPRMQAYVSFRGYRTSLGGAQIDSGNFSEGWLSILGDEGSAMVHVRDFRQNFPKALRADIKGTIEIGLFPDEFGPGSYAFNLRSGEHKTHEIMLAFGEAKPHTGATRLFAKAPAKWYVESGAFGFAALPDTKDWPDHEKYVGFQLDTSPTRQGLEHLHKNIFDAIETTDFFGIFDYGDWPIDYEGYGVAPLNCKYDYDLGMWLQWARSSDDRWFALAEAADRHFADIDILHNLHSPRHWGDGIAFGHSYHDEDGFKNPHRNEGGSHPDTAYGAAGMLLLYYLTGYGKAYESAVELADCIEYRLRNDEHLSSYFPKGNDQGYGLDVGLYEAGCRPAANCLSIAVAAYRATGDERYLQAADALVDWARAGKQPYINGPTGESRAVRPWMLNMYLVALANYLEMRDEYGLPDTFKAKESYLAFTDWLCEYALIDLSPINTGPRAAYPYEWWFDGRQGDPNDEWSQGNNVPSINNWLLLGADAMAYAYLLTGQDKYLETATSFFRTGTRDPFFEGDPLCYTETKQAINSIAFGHTFLFTWASN